MSRRGFWTKVNKRPDGCWEWLGCYHRDGSGKFCTTVNGRAKNFKASRYAWEEAHGPIAGGNCLVRVACWNSKCVNPGHGELMPRNRIRARMDAAKRPRDNADQAGEWSGSAKLRADDVREIRAYRGVRGAMLLLAKLYGISIHTAYNIVEGKTWRGVSGRPGGTMPLEKLRELVEQRGPASSRYSAPSTRTDRTIDILSCESQTRQTGVA